MAQQRPTPAPRHDMPHSFPLAAADEWDPLLSSFLCFSLAEQSISPARESEASPRIPTARSEPLGTDARMDATFMIHGFPAHPSACPHRADVTAMTPIADATLFTFLTSGVWIWRRETTCDSALHTKP
jgi:hypothetical protein